jgi:hypothetical protein
MGPDGGRCCDRLEGRVATISNAQNEHSYFDNIPDRGRYCMGVSS